MTIVDINQFTHCPFCNSELQQTDTSEQIMNGVYNICKCKKFIRRDGDSIVYSYIEFLLSDMSFIVWTDGLWELRSSNGILKLGGWITKDENIFDFTDVDYLEKTLRMMELYG